MLVLLPKSGPAVFQNVSKNCQKYMEKQSKYPNFSKLSSKYHQTKMCLKDFIFQSKFNQKMSYLCDSTLF